jgi:ribosomal protein S18 acetylase RimI-like enzyme
MKEQTEVYLKPLTSELYEWFRNLSVNTYAEQSILAGKMTGEEAYEYSLNSFTRLLPKGLYTEGHYIYQILLEPALEQEPESKLIGYIWSAHYPDQPEHAFIYDFYILECYRGKGYGKQTIKELNTRLRGLGFDHVYLHVYAFNERAVQVYRQAGFRTSAHIMFKPLET